MKIERVDGRTPDQNRTVTIEPGYLQNPEGSALISVGQTRVICTASVEEGVPRFLADSGRGWVTAEYGMLPRSTDTRMDREAARGKIGGRTMEIQRLIGRSLRAVVDMERLGERTIKIDCDVIQADGGTRTASITGAYVAMALACRRLRKEGRLTVDPLPRAVAAVSVGVVDGNPLLDLCYSEDSRAEVDMNVVMTDEEEFVEIQGTAESVTFSKAVLDSMTRLAWTGIQELFQAQQKALSSAAE